MKKVYGDKQNYYEGWCYFHRRTDKALLVSTNADVKNAVWIPLSQCQNDPNPELTGEAPEVEICIPEWLAIDKGLV